MNKVDLLAFFRTIDTDVELEFTTASPSIYMGGKIYFCERDLDSVDWDVKEKLLHEIAHHYTDCQPPHSKPFYVEYIKLLNKYMVGEPQIEGLELTDDEIPYKDDVHLAAGVYDGLKREAFIEGYQAQLKKAYPVIWAKAYKEGWRKGDQFGIDSATEVDDVILEASVRDAIQAERVWIRANLLPLVKNTETLDAIDKILGSTPSVGELLQAEDENGHDCRDLCVKCEEAIRAKVAKEIFKEVEKYIREVLGHSPRRLKIWQILKSHYKE